MKRVLSGIKPSGEVQLGNYLGAMRRWAAEQEGRENFYFIPDLHALTARPKAAELAQNTKAAVAWLLAMGVDPEKHRSVIFVQSQIPQHSELAWIFNNFTTMGELGRMTQFKDKSQKAGADGQVVGLFTYPALMAADILLYDADEVPIGDDQKQHLELARDIASRFNNIYGDTFKLPEPTIQGAGARIMDLQDPSKKMSKSDDESSGCIFLTDPPAVIEQKIMRAVTDSGSIVQATDDKPAMTNLLMIFSLVSGRSVAELERDFAGKGYGDFKRELSAALLAELAPVQQRYQQLMADQTTIDRVIKQGREHAAAIAGPKLEQVKQKLGLIS